MSVQPKDLLALHAPTPPDAIKQRQGPGGRSLSYVDARYVEQFLDDVIGPANWQRRHVIGEGGKVACEIGIRITHEDGVTEWVVKSDGAGDTDIEGEKGSFSDSFKRAAVSWGIARDLYGTGGQRNSSPARPPAPVTPQQPPAAAAGGEPPWPEQAAAALDDASCPIHHKEWRQNSRGYYCATKVGEGWCKEQPSKAWQARREVA